MKKKRLISLMLAGMMAVGVGAMAGCEESESTEAQKVESIIRKGDYAYIVLRINETDVLHKGDVDYLRSSTGSGSVYMGFNSYKFDCGKTYTTNSQCFISTSMPSKEVYDEICEDCLGDELEVN